MSIVSQSAEAALTANATFLTLILTVNADNAAVQVFRDFCTDLPSLTFAVTTVQKDLNFFNNRDLLGFIDGTESPAGEDRPAAVLIGTEDAAFAGGAPISSGLPRENDDRPTDVSKTRYWRVALEALCAGHPLNKARLATNGDATKSESDRFNRNCPPETQGLIWTIRTTS